MKLELLNEGDFMRALQHASGASYGRKSLLGLSSKDVKPENGEDFGSRVAGFTSQPTGVPRKPRHRKFLGVSTRQFSLTPPGI
jgi:hypothetical protein